MDASSIDQMLLIICCHPKDRKLKDELIIHLNSMSLVNHVIHWSADDVLPGENLERIFSNKLETAKAAVVLLSAELLADEYLIKYQVLPLIARQKQFQLHLIPIIVSHCNWQSLSGLANLKPLNDQLVLQAMRSERRDELFALLSQQVTFLAKRFMHPSMPLVQNQNNNSDITFSASNNENRILKIPHSEELVKIKNNHEIIQHHTGQHEQKSLELLGNIKIRSVTVGAIILLTMLIILNVAQFIIHHKLKMEMVRLDGLRRPCLSGSRVDCVQLKNHYQHQCETGDSSSCLNVGVMYKTGLGLEKNPQQAAAFFRQACVAQNMNGCYNLASLYLNGIGVIKDEKRALSLYEKSCNNTNGALCVNLGKMYAEGTGTIKNPQKALAIYQVSCEAGEVIACANLGIMYGRGEGVERDFGRAQDYLQPACEKNENDSACIFLAEIYEKNAVYREDIIKYLHLACQFGNSDGCYRAGVFYESRKSYENALRNYDKACQLSSYEGCFSAGLIQESANERSNFSSALSYYKIACENDHWKSCNNLGKFYEEGKRINKDNAKGFFYYYRACEHGHAIACYNIAQYYQFGKISPIDMNMAIIYYDKACQLGNRDACDVRRK